MGKNMKTPCEVHASKEMPFPNEICRCRWSVRLMTPRIQRCKYAAQGSRFRSLFYEVVIESI